MIWYHMHTKTWQSKAHLFNKKLFEQQIATTSYSLQDLKEEHFWYLAARTAGCARKAGFKPQSHSDSLLGCLARCLIFSGLCLQAGCGAIQVVCFVYGWPCKTALNVCMLQGIQFQLLKGVRIHSGWWFQTQPSKSTDRKCGGFKHFLFSIIYGIILPID